MKYFKKMVGKKCYLSPMHPDDYELYTEWLNDPEVVKYLSVRTRNLSLPAEKLAIENLNLTHTYGIVDIQNDELLGNCGLDSIDAVNRIASIGIFIGNKTYWNKGYGEEALHLLIDFAYNILNIQNIMLTVYEDNPRAKRCYEKTGFKEIGRRRKARYINRHYYDEIYMDLLPEDFYK